MARPIKETPILTGKYARQFERAIEANKGKKIPREDYERAMRNFKSIKIVIDKPVGA